MVHKVSVEKLCHFRCESESCLGWWTIADAPKLDFWYCPWCGKKEAAYESWTAVPAPDSEFAWIDKTKEGKQQ